MRCIIKVLSIGKIGVHNHSVHDVYKMSFLEMEDICKDYGYRYGDLIHYKIPDKSLDEGLRLISSNHDVIEMVSRHVCHGLAELYLVSYNVVEVDPEDDNVEDDEEYKMEAVFRNDAFWDEVFSVDIDASESNEEKHVESANAGGSSAVEDAERKLRMIGKGNADDAPNVDGEEGEGNAEDAPNADVEEISKEVDEEDGNSEDIYSGDIT